MADPKPSPDAATPKRVTRFEANLIRLLRFFYQQTPRDQAIKLLNERVPLPATLTPDAVDLVKDSLAKGTVLYLVRAGGWQRAEFLRGGSPKFGRVWERIPVADLTLRFTRHGVDFLTWLTANRASEVMPVWQAPGDELTPADELLFFLAYQALRAHPETSTSMRTSPTFGKNALCRLAFPEDFANNAFAPPVFDRWLTEPGCFIFEAMLPVFERYWLERERSKGQIADWEQMRRQGEAEGAILQHFFDDVDRSARLDLARFLLVVLRRILSGPEMNPTFWIGGLKGNGPTRLEDRLETQRNALALLQQADRFRQWQRRAQSRGFYDEDYPAAKYWLGQYESLEGEEITARAERIVRMIEPLHR